MVSAAARLGSIALAWMQVASAQISSEVLRQHTAPSPEAGKVDPSGRFVPADGGKPEEPAGPPLDPKDLAKRAETAVRRLDDGTVMIGDVTLDAATRTLSFPASVQMREGEVEYALVTTRGKVHESLLATTASPLHIHLAAILLKLYRADQGAEVIPLAIEIEWKTNGPPRREPLEKLVVLARDHGSGRAGTTLPAGGWRYTGSLISQGAFLAEREGSLISLIRDPDALVQNHGTTSGDDTLHLPNAGLLPSQGMQVTVRMRPADPLPAE